MNLITFKIKVHFQLPVYTDLWEKINECAREKVVHDDDGEKKVILLQNRREKKVNFENGEKSSDKINPRIIWLNRNNLDSN